MKLFNLFLVTVLAAFVQSIAQTADAEMLEAKTCYTDVTAFQKVYFPDMDMTLEQPATDEKFVDLKTQVQLQEKGYEMAGGAAYQYDDNVSIYISVDEDLKAADIKYRRWVRKDYGSIVPSYGDAEIMVDSHLPLTSKDMKGALQEALRKLRPCSEVLQVRDEGQPSIAEGQDSLN